MGYEVIPFNVFMAVPVPHVLSWGGGLTFFVGAGVVLLGLVALEKMGIKVNETAVRWTVLTCVAVFVVWSVLKMPLFRHVLFGF